MITLKMNNLAVGSLGLLAGFDGLEPPGGLAPGLRDRLAVGIRRRGKVLTWADCRADPDGAPGTHQDLTGWECFHSSFHLEHFVPVDVKVIDCQPTVTEADQRVLLRQGIAFAREFARLVYALDPPCPVRCIIGANDTCATFRFHQIHPGESWNLLNLDLYEQEKSIDLDIMP